jgi:hypothetical protein
MFFSGVPLIVHGSIALTTGVIMVAAKTCSDTLPPHCIPLMPYTLGIPVLAHGVIALAVGVPLTVHGGARVRHSAMPAVNVHLARKTGTLTWLF